MVSLNPYIQVFCYKLKLQSNMTLDSTFNEYLCEFTKPKDYKLN